MSPSSVFPKALPAAGAGRGADTVSSECSTDWKVEKNLEAGESCGTGWEGS